MSANVKSTLVLGIVVIGGLSVLSVGCSGSGDSGSPIVGPSPISLVGDYTVTESVTSNTCGTELPGTRLGNVRLEVGANGLEYTDIGNGGACATCASQQSGSTLTQTRTETLTNGSCVLLVETTSSLTFVGTHFTSIESSHYAYDSGECFGFTACDIVTEGQGEICTDCWPGCAAGPASVVLGAGSQRMVFQVAPIEE